MEGYKGRRINTIVAGSSMKTTVRHGAEGVTGTRVKQLMFTHTELSRERVHTFLENHSFELPQTYVGDDGIIWTRREKWVKSQIDYVCISMHCEVEDCRPVTVDSEEYLTSDHRPVVARRRIKNVTPAPV